MQQVSSNSYRTASDLLQFLNIGEVFQATAGPLVDQKIFFGNEGDHQTVQVDFDSTVLALRKLDRREVSKKVH